MLNDVRHALRLVVRHPGFTTVACLTLALGIGANAAIFSLVDAALFRPLPYRDADRLVNAYRVAQTIDGSSVGVLISGEEVDWVRAVKEVFDGVEVFSAPRPKTLAKGLDQTPWVGAFPPALPAFLGVSPQIGRVFTSDDVAARDAIILSDGFWQRAFGRDPAVLGKTIAFSDHDYVVIGVMPPTFRYFLGAQADAWLSTDDRGGGDLVARLRPGLTIAQAQRQLDVATAHLPGRTKPLQLRIAPAGWNRTEASARTMLLSVMGAVGFVLVIACANVANLLLARTLSRQREIAVRGSLGATRGQLVRQFLVEGLVIACLGGVAATVVAWWAIGAIPAMIPGKLTQWLLGAWLPHLDARVVAFGCLSVLVTGLICGAVPAIRASRPSTAGGFLTAGARAAGPARGQRRIRDAFQALQIALTVILLAGAGLLIFSFLRLSNTPDGFDANRLAYVSLTYPAQSFPQSAQRVAFADELVGRVSTLPGVLGAALGQTPVSGGTSTESLASGEGLTQPIVARTSSFFVGTNYFQVSGIPIEDGRAFEKDDRTGAPAVVIISENGARRLWPGQSAVGQRLQRLQRGERGQSYTVVGVTPHLKTIEVANDDVELFFPNAQARYPFGIVVRTAGDLASLADAIRAEVRAINPNVVIQRIGTVENLFAEFDPLGSPRLYAVLLGSLAVLGLLTAAVGLYGVVSFAVSQRTREIGVRMALGADISSVWLLVVRGAVAPVLSGIAVGLLAATWLSRLVASQLFHTAPRDPAIFAIISALLLLTCGLAIVAPATRAARTDAVEALRAE